MPWQQRPVGRIPIPTARAACVGAQRRVLPARACPGVPQGVARRRVPPARHGPLRHCDARRRDRRSDHGLPQPRSRSGEPTSGGHEVTSGAERALMQRSHREHFAVGAFNLDKQETLQAIARATRCQQGQRQLRSPLCLPDKPGASATRASRRVYAREADRPGDPRRPGRRRFPDRSVRLDGQSTAVKPWYGTWRQ